MSKGVSGFLYAVGVDWFGPIKIGVAINVERRLERLQSGNHLALTLLWKAGPFNDPFALEAQLHNAFEPHRVRGEWFAIPSISAEALTAAVAGAEAAVRLFPEPDNESKAASAACAFLIERLRREGLSIEDAMGSLAASTGMGRSTIWSLRYRPALQITVGPYSAITAELWRVTGNVPFGNDLPSAEDVQAVLRGEAPAPRQPTRDLNQLTALTEKLSAAVSEAAAEAELGIAPSRTGTEG